MSSGALTLEPGAAVRELWAQYLESRAEDAPSTRGCRRNWSQVFCNYFEGRQLGDLTRADLEACLQWLLWTPRRNNKLPTPNTVYQGMAMLRQFLRWAARTGLVEDDPTFGWVIGRPTARERTVLSRGQVDAILTAPPSSPIGIRDRAILHVVAELGLYGEPCRALNLTALDLVASQLGGMRLSARLGECLQRYVRHARPALLTAPDEPALFLTKAGKRLGKMSVEAVLLRHFPAQRISPRVLRRSWMAHRDAFVNRRLPES